MSELVPTSEAELDALHSARHFERGLNISSTPVSELADFAVYTPLQRRRLLLAVVASSMVGLVVDSLVFLWLAFGSFEFLMGQAVGKAWAVLAALPLVRLVRRVTPVPA